MRNDVSPIVMQYAAGMVFHRSRRGMRIAAEGMRQGYSGEATKPEIGAAMRYDELKDMIKDAMKAHDKVRLSILRQLHGEIKNIEVDERREATEADVDAMTKRLIKQTKETLEGSVKAGTNEERTETLRIQVAILEDLLPEQLSGDALCELVDATIAELGATTKRDMGKVMGALTKATGGNFDKAAAAKIVGGKLA